MNRRPFFDAIWLVSIFLGSVAVLPQLWMVNMRGGQVHSLTCHYIAAMALSRLLSGIFMWYARNDITCAEWFEGYNQTTFAILLAQLIHTILLADFAVSYAVSYTRSMMKTGLGDCR